MASPDLTSVTTLTKNPTKLARELKLTPAAIYRWRKVNRIPGSHIIKVANFYNVEVLDLLPLTGSDKSADPKVILKPRDTIPTLLNVQKGIITPDDASKMLKLPIKSLKLILTNWGDRLETLYDTLTRLELGVVSLDQGAAALGIAKYTLHGIRRKYGFAPGAIKRTRPEPTLPKRKAAAYEAALDVLAGKASAKDKADELGISSRTIFRKIEEISPLKIQDLAAFPDTFKRAYAEEIDKKLPFYAEKWMKIAESSRLFIRKSTKYPETPQSWRDAQLVRMLVGVLLGEAPLNEIAASRGVDPAILAGLFNSHLRAYDLTWSEVSAMGFNHQVALAELLLWTMDGKRKLHND